jgi:periplasmic protein CpxP/Spy
MMRRRLAGLIGAAAVAATVTTAFVHAHSQTGSQSGPQDGASAPAARHERRGPGGPGGPGGRFGLGGPGGFGRGGFGGLAILRQLELTDEQRASVRQVMENHRADLQGLAQRLRLAHKAQDAAVTAAQFDEQAVRGASAELATVMADRAVLHARVHSEVFAVLTPEQQAKAAELKAQRQARVDQRRERVRERVKERRQRVQPDAPQQ